CDVHLSAGQTDIARLRSIRINKDKELQTFEDLCCLYRKAVILAEFDGTRMASDISCGHFGLAIDIRAGCAYILIIGTEQANVQHHGKGGKRIRHWWRGQWFWEAGGESWLLCIQGWLGECKEFMAFMYAGMVGQFGHSRRVRHSGGLRSLRPACRFRLRRGQRK